MIVFLSPFDNPILYTKNNITVVEITVVKTNLINSLSIKKVGNIEIIKVIAKTGIVLKTTRFK